MKVGIIVIIIISVVLIGCIFGYIIWNRRSDKLSSNENENIDMMYDNLVEGGAPTAQIKRDWIYTVPANHMHIEAKGKKYYSQVETYVWSTSDGKLFAKCGVYGEQKNTKLTNHKIEMMKRIGTGPPWFPVMIVHGCLGARVTDYICPETPLLMNVNGWILTLLEQFGHYLVANYLIMNAPENMKYYTGWSHNAAKHFLEPDAGYNILGSTGGECMAACDWKTYGSASERDPFEIGVGIVNTVLEAQVALCTDLAQYNIMVSGKRRISCWRQEGNEWIDLPQDQRAIYDAGSELQEFENGLLYKTVTGWAMDRMIPWSTEPHNVLPKDQWSLSRTGASNMKPALFRPLLLAPPVGVESDKQLHDAIRRAMHGDFTDGVNYKMKTVLTYGVNNAGFVGIRIACILALISGFPGEEEIELFRNTVKWWLLDTTLEGLEAEFGVDMTIRMLEIATALAENFDISDLCRADVDLTIDALRSDENLDT